MFTHIVRAGARPSVRVSAMALIAAASLAGTPANSAPGKPTVEPDLQLSVAAQGARFDRLTDDRREILQAHRKAQRAAKKKAAKARAVRDRVLDLARREAGDPYVWGASGPTAFDCSGYTAYVFAQLGIALPHSSAAQAGLATRVSDPAPGDLVFFSGSGGVHHVGIYAGDGMLWHAPNSGDVVSLDPIWTSSGVFYGRVL